MELFHHFYSYRRRPLLYDDNEFCTNRMIKEMIRLVINGAGSSTEKNHVSSFQAFCVSTASRVGVGNIAGIAIAVVLGGPGAIFWDVGLSHSSVLPRASSNLH